MRTLTISCSILVVLLLTLVVQAFGDTSWSAGRPTTGLVYDDGTGGPVTLSNTYNGLDAGNIHDAQSGVSVNVRQYSPNYANVGGVSYDMYTLQVLGLANSRVPHKYIIDGYGANYYDCSHLPLYSNACTASGITAPNTGAWFNLPGNFYYGGTAFNRVFVCSNGWVAFEAPDSYTSNCGPSSVSALPGPDYVDSNSVAHDLPQGIIAPLWKPLDPSSGQIMVAFLNTSPPYECGDNNPCAFFVIWNQVATQGSSTACGGGPCLNTFSLAIWSPSCDLYCPSSVPSNLRHTGLVQVGYHSIDPRDGYKGIVSLDDASGYQVTTPDRDTAVCGVSPCPSNGNQGTDHGVVLEDFWWGNYLLSDSKIILTKGSTSDPSVGSFLTDYPYLYGYNTQPNTASSQPADLAPAVAAVGESVGLSLLCTAITGGLCFVVSTGTALAEALCHCGESLVRQFLFQPPASPVYRVTPMGSGQSATMEMPISQNNMCGIAGFKNCAVDTALWDTVQWTVPHDSGTHTLQVSYQVQAGSQIGGNSASTWETTSVALSVGPESDFSISSNCSSIGLQVGGSQTNCSVTLNAGSGFYGKVALSTSPPASGGPSSQFTNVPSTGVWQLSSNGQATTNLALQSGTGTGTYAITVTASSGIRVHTISINVNVYGLDGTAQAGCGHNTNSCTATFSTSRNNDIVMLYTFEALNLAAPCTFAVSDTAGLAWNYRGGVAGRADGWYGTTPRDQIGEFWAKSANILSSDVITESISGCASTQYGGEYNGLQVLAVNGAFYDSPFDPNPSIPGTANGYSNTPSVTMSTSNPGDMIISAAQQTSYGTLTPGTGFTGITANTEYEMTSSAVTNLAVTWGDSATWYWEQISDAIRATVGGVSMATSPSSFSWACNPYGCDNPSPASFVLTVTSQNGFSGNLPLSYVSSNSGGSLVTGPSSVNVPLGGSVQVTLYAYQASVSGDYTWTIQGGTLASTTVTISYRYCRCY